MATQTRYLTPDNIKVYPATNSPNDGNINTEYNAKTLAKSSASRNYILSGFQIVGSSSPNTFSLGLNTESANRIIRGSMVLDGYYVEIYSNIQFEYTPTSDAVLVFAIPHYAGNETPDRVKWEKSQHITGGDDSIFDGIRFECVSAKYKQDSQSQDIPGDYDYDPTHYEYTDDPGNTLPSYSLMVGFVAYDSQSSSYIDVNLMNRARWQYSKINAEDVALPPTDKSEHTYSSLIPLDTGTDEKQYPHTLAEYLTSANGVFVKKFVDDIKYGKLYFQNTSTNSDNQSYIYNDDDKLIIDVTNTEEKLVKVSHDLTAKRVFNAVYNDYAELYEKDDIEEEIVPGDVIELNPDTGKYRKCKIFQSKLVVGICSDSYGHLIGGDEDKTVKENLETYIPVGLCGRVYANTDDENCKPGDLVIATDEGKVTTIQNKHFASVLGKILGKCLSTPEDGKVLIQIMLG